MQLSGGGGMPLLGEYLQLRGYGEQVAQPYVPVHSCRCGGSFWKNVVMPYDVECAVPQVRQAFVAEAGV